MEYGADNATGETEKQPLLKVVLPEEPDVLEKRLDKLKTTSERQNSENRWQVAADYCNPNDNDIKRLKTKGQRKTPKRVTDVGIQSCRKFMKGMYAFAIGSGNFFGMRSADRELREHQDHNKYFSSVSQTMLYYLRSSNFDAEVMRCFYELGYIGTGITWSEYLDRGLNFITQHISRTWLDFDAKDRVRRVFVERDLDAEAIIDEFFDDELTSQFEIPSKVSQWAEAGNTDELTVVQSTCKNKKYVRDSILPHERRYITTYYLKDSKEPLRVDGHTTFPFHVARLYKGTNESYGRSCFDDCEKTVSLLNDERLTLIRGAKNRADPPWLEAADSRTRHVKTNAIHKVIYDPTAIGGPPQQMDIKSDVGVTEAMIQIDTKVVEDAFYVSSFNPLMGLKNMTATEAMERLNLGLSDTAPVTTNWYFEYLTGMLRRCYVLLDSKGKFPPPPAFLEGKPFEFEFTSKAALALKQIERYGMMNSWNDAVNVANGGRPDILDNYDVDAIARIGAESDNVDNIILLDKKVVKQVRDNRAAMQERKLKVQESVMMADAENKHANAISE